MKVMKHVDALSPESLRIHRRMSELIVMRKPPVAAVIAVYHEWRKLHGLPLPENGSDKTIELTAFACLHKARLRVSWATVNQRRESRCWLRSHGFSPDMPTGKPH